jgi:integrase
MASIEKNGTRWRVRDRVDGRKVTVATFDTKAQAMIAIETGNYAAAIPPTLPATRSDSGSTSTTAIGATNGISGAVTLGDFVSRSGYSMIHLRDSSSASAESHLRAHILPRWGAVRLADISYLDVQTWIADLHAGTSMWRGRSSKKPGATPTSTRVRRTKDGLPRRRSPKTVREIAGTFRRVLASAVLAGAIPVNPAAGVNLPEYVLPDPRFLSPSELAALTDAMPTDEYKLLVTLCSHAGLRIGEAFGLRWGQLDLFKKKLRVVETVSEVNGKLTFGPPKTRKGRRTVPMTPTLAFAFTDHRTALITAGTPIVSDSFVFAGHEGQAVRYRNFRDHVWDGARAKAIEGGATSLVDVTPHALRHTAISLWIAAHKDPKQVSTWAGHGSAAFTIDRYGHLFEDDDDDVMDDVDAFIAQRLGK